MHKVVLAQKTDSSVIKLIEQCAEPVFVKEGDVEDLKLKLRDATALIVGTWVKVNQEIIDSAQKLKVISRTGVGVDNVDVKYASSKGIMVLNTPAANSISVAEHALALICALSKCVGIMDRAVKGGNFAIRRQYLPVDIDGKTLGLIGLGEIGKQTAKKCIGAFNMRIIAYDPFVKEAQDGIVLCETMEEVFKEADYISLHMPLTDKTKNCIEDKMLSLAKPTSYLINTSRGGIVDEKALYEALSGNKLAGAALDVFENEPLEENSPLKTLNNILLTPHSAALTKECVLRVAFCAAEGVCDFIQGKEPQFIFNKSAL